MATDLDTQPHTRPARLPVEYATPAGLPSDVDVERAIVRLTPKCGATFEDDQTGERFTCARPRYGWFPDLHRTSNGRWFVQLPIVSIFLTSGK